MHCRMTARLQVTARQKWSDVESEGVLEKSGAGKPPVTQAGSSLSTTDRTVAMISRQLARVSRRARSPAGVIS